MGTTWGTQQQEVAVILDRTIKFRLGREEQRCLAVLSEVTGESRSAILRKLIRTAEIAQRPTVAAGSLRLEEKEKVAA